MPFYRIEEPMLQAHTEDHGMTRVDWSYHRNG